SLLVVAIVVAIHFPLVPAIGAEQDESDQSKGKAEDTMKWSSYKVEDDWRVIQLGSTGGLWGQQGPITSYGVPGSSGTVPLIMTADPLHYTGTGGAYWSAVPQMSYPTVMGNSSGLYQASGSWVPMGSYGAIIGSSTAPVLSYGSMGVPTYGSYGSAGYGSSYGPGYGSAIYSPASYNPYSPAGYYNTASSYSPASTAYGYTSGIMPGGVGYLPASAGGISSSVYGYGYGPVVSPVPVTGYTAMGYGVSSGGMGSVYAPVGYGYGASGAGMGYGGHGMSGAGRNPVPAYYGPMV
ncbi:MAG: hypothetical protein AB1847_22505, partial [bacterium]